MASHIARPVFATNATGAKVWTATYTPFGGVHTSTGALSTARFPGQWFQSGEPDQGALQWSDPPANGLHQNWMRDYDPTTGRYLQADPLGLIDGASVYGYAGQSPMMNMDPTGQCFGPWAIACAAAAWGAVSVYVGWLLDPDCYTWQEGLRDFTVGFAFGGFGQARNAAAKAGAYGGGAFGAWRGAGGTGGAAGVADEIGILRDALSGKGNFGFGQATADDATRLGEAWVGKGYTVASDGKTLLSADGLRQFRPPSCKPRLGTSQANFEHRLNPGGAWQGNGHLDISP